MTVRPAKAIRYLCPECEEPSAEKPEAWYPTGDSDEGYVFDEPLPVEVFVYECGHMTEDEPEPVEGYKCSNCGDWYADRDEARECCGE
jgi:uncharacterized protein YlaI